MPATTSTTMSPRMSPSAIHSRRESVSSVTRTWAWPWLRGRAIAADRSRRHSAACRAVEPPGSLAGELDGEIDERADVVVGRAEVDEARPQADPAVDRRRRHPHPAVVLDARGRARRCARSGRPAAATCRNGTIESGGGPQRGSSSSCAETSSCSSRAWRRFSSTASRNAWAPWARNASQSFSARNGREYSSVMSTMWPGALVRDVRLLVGERFDEIRRGGARAGRRRPSADTATCGRPA